MRGRFYIGPVQLQFPTSERLKLDSHFMTLCHTSQMCLTAKSLALFPLPNSHMVQGCKVLSKTTTPTLMGRENGLIVSSAIPPDFLPTCSFSRLLLCCVCLSVLQNLLVELRANQARRHCEPNGNPTPPSSLGPIRFALRGNGTVSGGKRMCFELAAKIFNMQVYSFQLSFSCLSACGLGLMKSRALKECCTQHLHTLFSRFSSTSESN